MGGGGGGSGCGGGSARLTGLGALDTNDDRVSFRMDFAVLDQVDVIEQHSDSEDPEDEKGTCRSQKTRVPSLQRKAVDEQEEDGMEVVALALSLSEQETF